MVVIAKSWLLSYANHYYCYDLEMLLLLGSVVIAHVCLKSKEWTRRKVDIKRDYWYYYYHWEQSSLLHYKFYFHKTLFSLHFLFTLISSPFCLLHFCMSHFFFLSTFISLFSSFFFFLFLLGCGFRDIYMSIKRF